MAGQCVRSQDKLRLFAAPSIAGSDIVVVANAIGVNVVADAIGVNGVVGADGTVVGQLLLNPALVPVSDTHRIRS
jgi:hypothetical protein